MVILFWLIVFFKSLDKPLLKFTGFSLKVVKKENYVCQVLNT